MAKLKTVVFLNPEGKEQIIPLAGSALLARNSSFPVESSIGLLNLIYRGQLPQFEQDLFFSSKRSWLIYEFKGPTASFMLCFAVYRKRLAAVFLDGTYEAEIFVDQGQGRTADELLSFVQSHQWDHSPFLFYPEEFQAILWGQDEQGDKKLKKFSWQTDKNYQLIQEILASFQKDDLQSFSYSSLLKALSPGQGQAATSIDLKSIRELLADFHQHWKAIPLLENQADLQQSYIKRFGAYQQVKKRKKKLFGKLQRSLWGLQNKKNKLLQQQRDNKKALNLLQKQIQESEKAFKQKQERRREELGFYQRSLNVALEKKSLYPDSLLRKKNPTAAGDMSVAEREKLLKRDRWIARKSQEVQQAFLEQIIGLHEQQQEQMASIQLKKEELQRDLLAIEGNIFKLDRQQSREVSEVVSMPVEGGESLDQLKMTHLEELIGQTEKQKELEIALIHAKREKEEASFQTSVQPFKSRMAQLDRWLSQKSNSFYSWLEDRFPDWQQSLGKVVREDILFHPALSPDILRINDRLFGIQLNISELEWEAPTVETLKQERMELTEEIEALQKKQRAFLQKNQKRLQNCEKRYRQRFKQLKQELKDIRFRNEQKELKRKKVEAEARLQRQLQSQKSQQNLLQLAYQKEATEKKLDEILFLEKNNYQEFLQRIESAREGLNKQLAQLESLYESSTDGKKLEGLKVDWDAFWIDQVEHISQIPYLEDQLGRLKEDLQHADAQREEHTGLELDQFEKIEGDFLIANNELELLDSLIWELKGIIGKKDVSAAEEESPSDEEESRVLISQYKMAEQEEEREKNHLLELGKAFLTAFEEENIFKLPNHVTNEKELGLLNERLKQLNDEKIEEIKEYLGRTYASLLKLIAEQNKAVREFPAQLQTMIDRFNKLLQKLGQKAYFLSTELRPSEHPFFRILSDILDFVEKEGDQLGGRSLFNPQTDSEANLRAIRLLEKLSDILKELPQGRIEILDSQQISVHVKAPDTQIQKLEELTVNSSWKSWALASLVAGCLALMKEDRPELELMLFVPDLDVYERNFADRWVEFLAEKEIRILSSTQWGTAASAFEAVMVYRNDGWMRIKKN